MPLENEMQTKMKALVTQLTKIILNATSHEKAQEKEEEEIIKPIQNDNESSLFFKKSILLNKHITFSWSRIAYDNRKARQCSHAGT